MIPTRIGQKFNGVYLAGINRIRNCAYLILVAPKSTESSVQFKTKYSSTSRIQSVNDGWTNTNAMNDSAHPAAQYCRSLTVGGHTDLYLPSRDELELCYRNLKPTADDNFVYSASQYLFGNLSLENGANCSSIPTGAAYTETNPASTIVTAFQTGNVEAFAVEWYWTSTESSSSTIGSLIRHFSNGYQNWHGKSYVRRVRGVRRSQILLNDEKHNDTN